MRHMLWRMKYTTGTEGVHYTDPSSKLKAIENIYYQLLNKDPFGSIHSFSPVLQKKVGEKWISPSYLQFNDHDFLGNMVDVLKKQKG